MKRTHDSLTAPLPATPPLPVTQEPATPPPNQGQTTQQVQQPAPNRDAAPVVSAPASQPAPEDWSPADTEAGATAPAGMHNEPRLHASAALTIPPKQATQRVPPMPSKVTINLSNAGTNRHSMIRQALVANPTASSIALDSATLDDLQFLSQEASQHPSLRHVSVSLTIEKEQEGHESAIAAALAKIPGLTSIEVAVTRSQSTTYVDKLLGSLAKACRPTLESIALQGGQYNSADIVLAFAAIRNHQSRLKSLALDNAHANDDAAQQNLMREAARLGSLKHVTLSNQTSEDSAQWLPELLSNNTLESLTVALDFIDSDAAQNVGDALAANRSIRHLKFDRINFFHIDQDAGDADDGHTDGDTDSEDAGDYVGQPLYQSVAEGLAKNQTLESVHFAFDDIDSSDRTFADTVKDIGLMIAAIGRHPRITDATLKIPEDANFNDVLQLLENSPRLQRLTLIGNLCSPQQYEQLALAIEKHPTLLAFNFLPLLAQKGETMAARAKARWEIADPGDVFEKLQSRINTALAQNHGKRLGGALTGMMELREPAPNMLPTPPQEINELIMTQGLASLSGADRENLIKAFKL